MVFEDNKLKVLLNILNNTSIDWREYIYLNIYIIICIVRRNYYIPRIKTGIYGKFKSNYLKAVYKHLTLFTAKSDSLVIRTINEKRIVLYKNNKIQELINSIQKQARDLSIREHQDKTDLEILAFQRDVVSYQKDLLELEKEKEKQNIESKKIINLMVMGAVSFDSFNIYRGLNMSIDYNVNLKLLRLFVKDSSGSSEILLSNFRFIEHIPVYDKLKQAVARYDIQEVDWEIPNDKDYHATVERSLDYTLEQSISITYGDKPNEKLVYRLSKIAIELNGFLAKFYPGVKSHILYDDFIKSAQQNIIIKNIGDERLKVKINQIVPFSIVEQSDTIKLAKKGEDLINVDINVYNVLNQKVLEIKSASADKINDLMIGFEHIVPVLNNILRSKRLALFEDTISPAGSKVYKLDYRKGL